MRKTVMLAVACLFLTSACKQTSARQETGEAASTENIGTGDTAAAALQAGQDTTQVEENTLAGAEPQTEAEAFGKRLSEEAWTADDYGFRYPGFMTEKTTYMSDVVADVTEYKSGSVSLCLWPMIGSWATNDEAFPVEGSVLSPQAKIATITYRARGKDIHSGYTDDGRIFYLKRKIIEGHAVNHASVLVAIYPESYRDSAKPLVREVQNW